MGIDDRLAGMVKSGVKKLDTLVTEHSLCIGTVIAATAISVPTYVSRKFNLGDPLEVLFYSLAITASAASAVTVTLFSGAFFYAQWRRASRRHNEQEGQQSEGYSNDKDR